jgi:predicted DNA-binding transcriptional regulator AlpA
MSDLRRSIAAAGGLYTRTGLAERWGVTRQAVSKMVLKPDFPKPILVDGKHEAWPANEADAWRGV